MAVLRLADARTGLCMLLLVAAAAPAHALDSAKLVGDWVGERDGQVIVWRLLEQGRLRIDGRPADFTISTDTLVVRFDPPCQPSGTRLAGETAVYRFLVGATNGVPTQLFVYGFDLGPQGIWLERETEEPPLPEDAAPPVPAPNGHAQAAPDRRPPTPGR
jgi:hypothetical protein